MNDFQIIPFSEKYLDDVIALFRKAYGKTLSKDYWNWRFNKNPFGKPFIQLCLKENHVIALYLVHPITVILNSEIKKMLFSMFTMTDPDFSGRGIMTKLYKKTVTDNVQKQFPTIIGFANNNSRYMFTKKLNFSEITKMKELCLDIKNNSFMQIYSFDDNFSNFFENYKPVNHYAIFRSKDYLNWRFFENPENEYIVYEIKIDQELQGYFVLKIFENKKCHIIDFMYKNDQHIDTMINKSIEFCKNNEFSLLTLWANPLSKLFSNCIKNGFYLNHMPTYFLINSIENCKLDILDFNNWHITMSDSDVF